MIEKIEHLGPKLDLLPLRNFKILLQRKIEGDQVWTAQVADAGVAKLMCRCLTRREWRSYKRSLVVPAIECLMTWAAAAKVGLLRWDIEREIIRICELIGAVTETTGVAQVTGHTRSQRFSALYGGYPRQLPSTQKRIHYGACVRQKVAVAADRQLIQIADGKAVAKIRHYRTMLQIRPIRILDKSANIAIGVAHIVGIGVGSEEVQSISEALVQRRLERVVKHLQLRIIEGQHGCHIRLLTEILAAIIWVRAAGAGGRSTKVRIRDLRSLVQIAGLVVPQVIRACADVTNLSQPVLSKLMLHAQIPLHNSWNDPLRARGFYRPKNVYRIPGRNHGWEPGRDELRRLRRLAGAEILCYKRRLGRVLPKVIKNIGLRRVKHPEGTSHYCFFADRPRKTQTRPPIARIEVHSGVRNGARPEGCDHDRFVQIEIADLSASG